VLLLQVAALEQLVRSTAGLAALVAALVLSRLVPPALCSRGIPAARTGGLGALVAGSVSRTALAGSVAGAAAALVTVALVTVALPAADAAHEPPAAWHVVAFLVVPAVVTALFARRCLRRFGGVTGDVIGACVEVAFTAALLVAVL
jgi:adenosylcobinamide-GDP ribazoletransferase